MSVKQQIEIDLKTAMLAGNKVLVTTLRGLKSAILNVEVAENKREVGLPDVTVISILQKEAKKRQESADLFAQGGNTEKQQEELTEKTVIEQYLPVQLSEAEIQVIVDEIISSSSATGMQAMGQTIAAVKQRTGPNADGSVIAKLVKEKLSA